MRGHLHPFTLLLDRLNEYFLPRGFEILYGPEVETEDYNFNKLNMPADHPARDIQDTFYLKGGNLLRTQTSSIQIRAMESHRPPVRIIAPGRVYRNEANDSHHSSTFHHLEGLVIEKGITIGHLIGTLEGMLRYFFHEKIDIRTRINYFPFVEPAIEIDIRRKGGDWIELLGAGMVHPKVLKEMKVDHQEYNGFAFGMGMERLLMVAYGINDIRALLNSDYRLLGQFPQVLLKDAE